MERPVGFPAPRIPISPSIRADLENVLDRYGVERVLGVETHVLGDTLYQWLLLMASITKDISHNLSCDDCGCLTTEVSGRECYEQRCNSCGAPIDEVYCEECMV